MNLTQKFQVLQYLYHLEMFGEQFCDEITLENHQPYKQKALGLNPKNAKIGFISQSPLLGEDYHFLPKKSAKMLESMITKVFCLKPFECSILSLFKTNSKQENFDEIQTYLQILLTQIKESSAGVFVIFGLHEVAELLFSNTNLQLGTPFNFREKTFVITHPFGALIRLESLKRQTLQHLKIAKGMI